jgi:hypothetical protein
MALNINSSADSAESDAFWEQAVARPTPCPRFTCAFSGYADKATKTKSILQVALPNLFSFARVCNAFEFPFSLGKQE